MIDRICFGYVIDMFKIELFDFAVGEVEQGGFRILQITYDLHNDPLMGEGNIMTEYEQRFSSKGNPICKYILGRQ